MKNYYIFLIVFLLLSCESKVNNAIKENTTALVVLGTIQDAGSPHIACKKMCCENLFNNPDKNRKVVALGLIDNTYNKKYLF